MNFALTVLCAPHNEAAHRALQFATACLASGHTLSQVFFYQDGVYNANALASPPQDELNMASLWQALQKTHATKLYVCVASAIRRGIVDENEAKRHGVRLANLAEGFEIVGLGQLMAATQTSDRCITFG
ncbi:sulfurtransferase complex subunit TusD [Halioxenophilus aromaticivorans]|uniref:Sulfurtransferase complex subunit TusD n=1 Tax=Halioxenophilus aromaticivorans TaxID=1306992 RepID=A0AAV3UBD0_9ALTE